LDIGKYFCFFLAISDSGANDGARAFGAGGDGRYGVVANTIAASAAPILGSWVGWDILDNNLCEMKLVAIEPSCFILK
jgi:hypothetical protein